MTRHTQEAHQNAMDLYHSNCSITDISRKTGISRTTIYNWINKAQLQIYDPKRITLREVNDLRRRVERMENIIGILQEVPCSTYSTIEEKCKAIESLSYKYSETQMCYALKLPKGTYFNYKNRGKHGLKANIIKKNELTPIIESIFRESKGIYGAPKICAILRNQGHTVSPEFVSAIMRDNEWISSRCGAKRKYINSKKRKNILNRKFNVSKPNEVWVGDVTYFRVNDRTLYLCVIIDLFSRKVIAYRVSTSNSTQLTKKTFKAAFESRNKPKGLLFHSDQGSNYTSVRYHQFLKECGVTHSFSKPGTPYDNSVIESFFKNLKNERLYITDPQTHKTLKEEIDWYITFYNTERPHETLHYMTPDEMEVKYSKEMRESE